MLISLSDFLESERQIFLASFDGLEKEQLDDILFEWEPRAVARYRAMEQQEKNSIFLKTAEERVDNTETGVVETQDAIAELGVIAADNAVSMEDVMDALAELGALIASLTE
jgi:hypothetical protein